MSDQSEKASTPFSVDDVLVSRWGYDQTNVDFYQVTRCTPATVWLAEIDQDTVHDHSAMRYTTTPVPGSYVHPAAKPLRRKIHDIGNGPFVRIETYSMGPIAREWDNALVIGTTHA